VFQFFAASYKYVPELIKNDILKTMVGALYHTENDETFKGADAGNYQIDKDSLKLLAGEVLSILQRESDPNTYVNVYQSIREHVVDKRRERREKKIMQSVIDPQASSRAKIKKNLAKQKQRKRKVQEFAQEKIKSGKIRRLK
jgi:hypothetical protein